MSDVEVKIYDSLDNPANDKQINLISNILKKGKRTFGSSGASLTHQISDPKYKDAGIDSSLAKVGLEGEHKTTHAIKDWMKDKPNVVMINSVHVKGYGKEEIDEETGVLEGGDTDCVLVIGNHVLLIDSKNWKGKRKYSVTEHGAIKRGTRMFPGGKVNTVKASYLWLNYLKAYHPSVVSIICITSEKTFVVRDKNWWKQSFKVVTLEDLINFLDLIWKRISDEDKQVINVNLVSAIVIHAIKPYDFVRERLGNIANLLRD